MKRPKLLSLPFIEAMNVLNRAQELCVLARENDEDRMQDCLEELNTAMSKLGRVCPDLDVCAEACEMKVKPTKPGFWADFGADDLFEYGTNDYYEQTCIDYHGSAVRDNTRAQRVAIGKDIEENGFED